MATTACAIKIKNTRKVVQGRPHSPMTGSGLSPTKLTPWLYLGRWKDSRNEEWMTSHNITHVVNCLDKHHGPSKKVPLDMYAYLSSHDTVTYPLFREHRSNSASRRKTAPVPGKPAPVTTNWDLVQEVLDDVRAKYHQWEKRRGKGKPPAALIYCMAGLNRSATLAAAYLATHTSMNIEKIATSIRAARKGALSNTGFVKQLALVLHKDCVDRPSQKL